MTDPARRVTSAVVLALCAVAVLPTPSATAGTGRTSTASARASAPVLVLSDPGADVVAPALSFTGRYLAYLALPTDLSAPQLQRTDLATGKVRLLNPAAGGAPSGHYSRPPVISADGTRVAYSTDADGLVAGDHAGRFDAFVRDVPAASTLLASAAPGGSLSNGDVGQVSLANGGRYAVFTSDATDLVPGSTTTNTDVYRRDLTTGKTVQVTVRPDGRPSRGPGAGSTDVSGDGGLVAFTSFDTDLGQTEGDDAEDADLFVRNMSTGTTRWLSAGLPAGADPSGVVMSPNGRWISTRWADGSLHLTRVGTGVTTTVVADGYALTGAFSNRGNVFVHVSAGVPYVRHLDTGTETPIAVPGDGSVTSVTVSGNGAWAAYDWTPAGGGPSSIFKVAL